MHCVASVPAGYRVELRNVTFRASRFAPRFVLREVSLTVEPGQFVAVVGLNGAGKSSLLRAIAGELEHVEGVVTVGGQRISRPINRIIDGVGVVHQHDDVDLIGHVSVAQNIAIRQLLGGGHPARLIANSEAWRRGVASVLGSEAQLGAFDLDEQVRTLAGGKRQMLSVAIAIHLEHRQNPCRLLLLDEHTSRLDHRNANRVMEYTVCQIQRTGATALMVTHRYSDALCHATRVVVLRDGNIAADQPVANFASVADLARLVEGDE